MGKSAGEPFKLFIRKPAFRIFRIGKMRINPFDKEVACLFDTGQQRFEIISWHNAETVEPRIDDDLYWAIFFALRFGFGAQQTNGLRRTHRNSQTFGHGFGSERRRHARKKHYISAEAPLTERFAFAYLRHRYRICAQPLDKHIGDDKKPVSVCVAFQHRNHFACSAHGRYQIICVRAQIIEIYFHIRIEIMHIMLHL